MTNRKRAERIVRKLIADLTDRRSFRQAWDGTDAQTKVEFRSTWVRTVLTELDAHSPEPEPED